MTPLRASLALALAPDPAGRVGPGADAAAAARRAPLLYVRFNGPAGMKATFYQGRRRPGRFPAPVAVGLRPGYRYRVRLDTFFDRPGLTLFPTLEVRGSLCLQPRFSAAAFPATVEITPADIEAAANGTLVTKVVYLEHPDRAEPKATLPGQILETDMPANADLLADARQRGRVILVLRLGERVPTRRGTGLRHRAGHDPVPGPEGRRPGLGTALPARRRARAATRSACTTAATGWPRPASTPRATSPASTPRTPSPSTPTAGAGASSPAPTASA